MTLRRRGNSWQASKTLPGTRGIVRRSFKTAAEAEAWLAGKEKVDRTMRLDDLLEITINSRWLGTKGEQTATIAAQACIDALGADYPVADIDEGTVQDLVGAFRKEGYAPATINRRMAAFSAMCQAAVKAGVLGEEPEIGRLKEGPGRTRVLSKEEQVELIQAIHEEGGIQHLAAELLFETGMRVTELLTVVSTRSFTVEPPAVTVRDSKSGASRTIPMTTRGAEILKTVKNCGYNFDYRAINTSWNRAKASLPWAKDDPEVVPHCARHTCATRLLQAGVPIRTVQEWLGHKTLAMTMRYTHLVPGALEAAARALEGATQCES